VLEDIGTLDLMRDRAERCRRLARQTGSDEVARHLAEFADELEEEARSLEEALAIL
jgi:hypothetical protein